MTSPKTGKIFPRPVEIDRIPPQGLVDEVLANAEECADIAQLLGVVAVGSCAVAFTISPWRKEGFKVSGLVKADVTYTCVVSLDEFNSAIAETFERYFLRNNAPGPRADAITVDPLEEEETDILEGNTIDIGAIALEALALAVDPYPRKPGVAFSGPQGRGDEPSGDTGEASPFAVLERLKQPR